MSRSSSDTRQRRSKKYRSLHLKLALELSLDKIKRHRLRSQKFKQTAELLPCQ